VLFPLCTTKILSPWLTNNYKYMQLRALIIFVPSSFHVYLKHDTSKRTSERTTDKMFKTITNYANELNSEGPYTSPNETKHGKVIRHEKVDQTYKITGQGQPPIIDPTDPVLIYLQCLKLISQLIRINIFRTLPPTTKSH
jgi:hypothetical protein